MARWKKTEDYLEQLKGKGYGQCDKLFGLYDKWKGELDIKALSTFLDILWKEKDNIKPKYLGENTYMNCRGTAFEEFCFDFVCKIVMECEADNLIQVLWNKKVLTEEFYMFEHGKFRKYPKSKAVDIVMGQSQGDLFHPLTIMSCKIWQQTNWLDEDRAIFDSVRNRYPNVVGYSLCMNLSAPLVSLISSQRTGLRIFDLSKEDQFNEFIRDIKSVIEAVKGEGLGRSQ